MGISIKKAIEHKTSVLTALSYLDWQKAIDGNIVLPENLINHCLLKCIKLPHYIQSLKVEASDNRLIIHVKVPILPQQCIRLEAIAFRFDHIGHFCGFSYTDKNNPMAIQAMLFVIEKAMGFRKQTEVFIRVDSSKKELWLNLRRIKQLMALLDFSFEEGHLKDLISLHNLKFDQGQVHFQYKLFEDPRSMTNQ